MNDDQWQDKEASARDALKEKLGELDNSLKSFGSASRHQTAINQANSTSEPQRSSARSGLGQGIRAISDLLAGMAVGGFLGYQADQWLGTKPWAMLVMLIIGFTAGITTIAKSQK